MAIYRTSKCPHCGYTLESMRSGRTEKIGHPYISCPDCGHIIETGKKYWFDFSASEKINYLLKELLFYPIDVFFTALKIILIPFAINIFCFDEPYITTETLIYLFGAILFLIAILLPILLFKIINLSPNKESSK